MVADMREMKDSGISWIGEIPKDWETYPLKYNFDFIAGATPDSSNVKLWDGDVLWITPADYKTKDVYVSGGARNLSDLGFKSCSTHMLPVGTVVVSKRAPIGYVAVTTKPLCTNQGCLGLVRRNNSVCEKYYYYALSIYDEVLNLYGSGTTFKEISAAVFGRIKVANPSFNEQQAIVVFLDSKCAEIDALSADILSEIDTLEAYKRSVITEAVTKGLNKTVPMKDSGIEWVGEIPATWDLNRIQCCLREINVQNSPIQTTQVLSLVKDVGVMLYEEKGDIGNTAKTDVRGYKLAYPNTLVVNSMNILIGSVGISKYFGCVSPVYYVFCETEIADLRYINYIFNTRDFQKELRKYANGILEIRLRVSAYDIFKRKIPLPSKEEQVCIADYLDSKCEEIDSIIAQKKEQLAVLADYKKSVIYEYVTGKKEVPVA